MTCNGTILSLPTNYHPSVELFQSQFWSVDHSQVNCNQLPRLVVMDAKQTSVGRWIPVPARFPQPARFAISKKKYDKAFTMYLLFMDHYTCTSNVRKLGRSIHIHLSSIMPPSTCWFLLGITSRSFLAGRDSWFDGCKMLLGLPRRALELLVSKILS